MLLLPPKCHRNEQPNKNRGSLPRHRCLESGVCCLGLAAFSTGDLRAQVAHVAQKKVRNRAAASHAQTRGPVHRGQPAQMHGQKQTTTSSDRSGRSSTSSLGAGRLGSPSGRTPWTSCPVTWLFGVETGGRPRRPGEELWGLRWGGPVAESSRQSVQASPWAGSCGRSGRQGPVPK